MFFAPDDFLQADPVKAESEREAKRLRREAEQRAKLCEATTRLAAKGDLEAAAIHLAARRAGVGQGTYYKLYGSRDACLREAFERCAEVVLARVKVAAARNGGDFASRLEAGLSELLALLDADPDVAHLLLVAILAGDVRCREARERALGRFAVLLASGREHHSAPARGSLAWLAAAAIASTLALWLDRDNTPPRPQMLKELVGVASWVQVGATLERPVVAEGGGEEPRSGLPDTAHGSRREARREREKRDQRRRILAAMVECVGKKGYKAAGLGEVLGRAGVSAPLFYSHFASKEECLLAAFDAELAAIERQVAAGVRDAQGCADRAQRGLEALLKALATGRWRAAVAPQTVSRR